MGRRVSSTWAPWNGIDNAARLAGITRSGLCRRLANGWRPDEAVAGKRFPPPPPPPKPKRHVREWTDEEKETLRACWRGTARAERAAKRKLPGRSSLAIRQQAKRMGLVRKRSWKLDEEKLRTLWQTMTPRELRTALGGRSWSAILERARLLGLPFGPPKGCESLNKAAERCGVNHAHLLRILAACEVPLRECYPNNRAPKKFPRHYVDSFEVTRAVEWYSRSVLLTPMAREYGIHEKTLRKWVDRAGLTPRIYSQSERFEPEEVERVLREHGATKGAAPRPRGRPKRC